MLGLLATCAFVLQNNHAAQQQRTVVRLAPPSQEPLPSTTDEQNHKADATSQCTVVFVVSVGGTYSTQRTLELLLALKKNTRAVGPACMHVLTDGPIAPTVLSQQAMLLNLRGTAPHVTHLPQQPTFGDLVSYINNNVTAAQPTDPPPIVILANADIVVDFDSIFSCHKAPALRAHLGSSTLLALTRHPWPGCAGQSGGGSNPKLPQNLCTGSMPSGAVVNSADTFIFQAPLRLPHRAIQNLNFVQNIRGAENRFLFHVKQSGYAVQNPCAQLITHHLHCTQERAAKAGMAAPRADARQSAPIPRTHLTCTG